MFLQGEGVAMPQVEGIEEEDSPEVATGSSSRDELSETEEELSRQLQSGQQLKMLEHHFWLKALTILIAILIATYVFCVLTGNYGVPKQTVFLVMLHGILDKLIWVAEIPAMLIPGLDYSIANPIAVTWNTNTEIVVWNVRNVRICGVIFIGGGIAVAGASYQCLFRNPLVSESILGVSNGAGFGASLALLLMLNATLVNIFAFVGGILAVFLTYYFSKMLRGNQTLLLVLTGIVVSSVFSAGISIVKYIAPPDTSLPDITFWLMGSFGKIGTDDLAVLVVLISVCVVVLMCFRWKMNILALGDDEARTLGINVERTRVIIIIASTLIASVSTCVVGTVPWVGIVIPQITRSLVGPDARKLMPCAFLVGAIFLMLVDVACRALLAVEIPVGIVTSLVGAPIFFIILKRSNTGWA